MQKFKKTLASLVVAGMVLTMVPFNAYATETAPTRLAGNSAEQTAVAIAYQTGWTGTAILASSTSYGMVDALTAGPLSFNLKAPIFLTGAGDTLNADTKTALKTLNITKVYVTSGTAVISRGVLAELEGMNITLVKLGGLAKADTSVNIAKQMVGVTKVAIANGLQDALSIASIASASNEPILLTDKYGIPDSVKAFLTANPNITSSDVIGGTGIISDAVMALVPKATRHFGYSAYDTNDKVIKDFAQTIMFNQVYVASGVTGIDALAGAPLAAQTKSAIVLSEGTVPSAATFVNSKLTSTSVVTALGGTSVVPNSVLAGVGYNVTVEADPTAGNSRLNPAPLNRSKTISVKDYIDDYTAQISVKQIIRGSNAWAMIKEANMFNSAPKAGFEYILAKINFKLIDIKDNKSIDIYGVVDFNLISSDGKQYDYALEVVPDPKLDATLYKGATTEGWAVYQVRIGDTAPVLTYGREYDGTGGVWFKAYN